ncbi:MAG: winged helix-turn-helix transcriptional regulator [Promethearchaeota archaeon]
MIAEKMGVDDIDCRIIDLLQKEPNLTHYQIAEYVNRSQPTVGTRIKRLEKIGVLKYQAGINLKEADLCFARIELQSKKPERTIEIVKHCPFLLNAIRLSGDINISIISVGLNYLDIDHIVNCHFRNDPDVVSVHIDIIADVLHDLVLPIDLNLEYGELDLRNMCNERCRYYSL